MPRQETIAGLDVGTTKTCVVVASLGPEGLEIIGVGEAPSAGLRKGVVTDLDQTVKSIEAACEKAERMAGVQITDVYVGVTGEHVRSLNSHGVVAVSGEDREVARNDVARVVDASKIIDLDSSRQILHALPRFYAIDGQDGVMDPIGMAGQRLEVETHIVTAGTTFLTNVLKCVRRAGLEARGVVFEPLASCAATLLPEEKHVGVILLDIGGGTTDVAVYAGGGVVHSAAIPVGGNILTNDIAVGLRTTLAEAEQIKRMYGTASTARSERDEAPIEVKTLDGRATRSATVGELRSIIGPRVQELFRLIKRELVEHAPRDLIISEVVLTGGGALLPDLDAAAQEFFGLPARVGVPQNVGGLTETVRNPTYATAVGLVIFGPNSEHAPRASRRSASGLFGRLSSWLSDLWS
ncbi:MAG TPA: cell division protein FtsA [Candidatus Dormibacteraeota bacterium]|nr:cell division protein FtsA [Candidatus Dormibacteraeota bacterium]